MMEATGFSEMSECFHHVICCHIPYTVLSS